MFVGMGANGASGGYNLENSLRFRSSASAYLSRTNSTNGNLTTNTISLWAKLGSLGTAQYVLRSARTGAGGNFTFFLLEGNKLRLWNSAGGSVYTAALFRDPSAWYHIVLAIDTTQATASNRIKIYVNGELQTLTGTQPNQNVNTYLTGTETQYFGQQFNTWFYDGYIAEAHQVDGQALTPSDFGETNSDTGVWQPKEYTGTYGTNGFYLKGRGTDNSGNGNNWTENNFNTATSTATTYDIMTDVPTLTDEDTANFATLNPLSSYWNPTYGSGTDGNLQTSTYNQGDAWTTSLGTVPLPSSGKYYWEVTAQVSIYCMVGVLATNLYNTVGTAIHIGSSSFPKGKGYYGSNGRMWENGAATTFGATYTAGAVIGVRADMDTRTMYWYKNNVLQGSRTLDAGVEYVPATSRYSSSYNTWNFGQRPFAYTPPAGYLKLNTFNLPDSSIVDGSEYFNTITWTADASSGSRSFTGVNFNPDFVWTKGRTLGWNHLLYDSVRGVGAEKELTSQNPNAEGNAEAGEYGYISSLDTDGFTFTDGTSGVYPDGSFNYSPPSAYVAWNWKAGGTAVSNTAGTITSSVSANPTAGFSVMTYTGTGANATVGHGLGVAPKMIIAKNRTSGVADWAVYHANLTSASYYLWLNSTQAQAASVIVWNNTAPTSTVFSVGTGSQTNGSTNNMVAYCFADVEGYSKIGSYTGNGSADGTFVYTGFRPAFILIKRTNSTGSWYMWDTARGTYNVIGPVLYSDLSAAEGTTTFSDILSNGFKLRVAGDTNINASSSTYIYMAFAENPFKNSLAR